MFSIVDEVLKPLRVGINMIFSYVKEVINCDFVFTC